MLMITLRYYKAMILVVMLFCTSCASRCSSIVGDSSETSNLNYSYNADKDKIMEDLTKFTEAPHSFGSKKQQEIAAYITKTANSYSDFVYEQRFESNTPNPKVNEDSVGPMPHTLKLKGTNIYAKARVKSESECSVLVGSHYDTKNIEGISYVGANDGGSSSALLLDLLRYFALKTSQNIENLKCDIIFVWLDGEESVLQDWTDGETIHPSRIKDNTYGSRFAASELTSCDNKFDAIKCLPKYLEAKPVVAFILLDMISSKSVKITQDLNSTPELLSLLSNTLTKMKLADLLSSHRTYIEDDHVPFLAIGVPSIDIIDFEHLEFWHKEGDEISNISVESIEIIGKVALSYLLDIAHTPKVSN